tara:strand:- start:116 stop:385 length:270 start_codon:yes stop_codon:yes gene_type:complete
MKDSSADLLMGHPLWQLHFEKLKWAVVEHVERRQLRSRPDQAAPRSVQPRDRILGSTVFYRSLKILVDSLYFLRAMQAQKVILVTGLRL